MTRAAADDHLDWKVERQLEQIKVIFFSSLSSRVCIAFSFDLTRHDNERRYRKTNTQKKRGRFIVEEVSKADAVRADPDSDEAKRQRRLTLSGADGRTFDGAIEAGQRSSYVVLVSGARSGEFNVMPMSDWYTFKNRPLNQSVISLDEIEKHMMQQRRQNSRLLVPRDEVMKTEIARKAHLEQLDEPLDQAAYVRRAPRAGGGGGGGGGGDDDDGDMAGALSDDDGDDGQVDGDDAPKRPVDITRVKSELRRLGVVDRVAATAKPLNDTGKRIKRLVSVDFGCSVCLF